MGVFSFVLSAYLSKCVSVYIKINYTCLPVCCCVWVGVGVSLSLVYVSVCGYSLCVSVTV